MGGSVWRFVRFNVQAEDIKLIKKFSGFVYHDPISDVWRVCETTTGGLLGQDKSREEAIYKANHNIEITPDLRDQMKKLGDPMQYQKVEPSEAFRRMSKAKD